MTKVYLSYIFGLHPQILAHSSQNLWTFLSVESDWSVLFCEWCDFWKASKDRDRLPRESTMWLEGWNFQFHPSVSGERKGAGGWLSHQWPMIQQWGLHKPQRMGFWHFPGWRKCGDLGRWGAWRRYGSSTQCKLQTLPPSLALYFCFTWPSWDAFFYNKPEIW